MMWQLSGLASQPCCCAVVNAQEGVGVSAALDLYNSLEGAFVPPQLSITAFALSAHSFPHGEFDCIAYWVSQWTYELLLTAQLPFSPQTVNYKALHTPAYFSDVVSDHR